MQTVSDTFKVYNKKPKLLYIATLEDASRKGLQI